MRRVEVCREGVFVGNKEHFQFPIRDIRNSAPLIEAFGKVQTERAEVLVEIDIGETTGVSLDGMAFQRGGILKIAVAELA